MRNLLKNIIFTVFAFLIMPITLFYYLLAMLFSKDTLISSFSQFLSLLPGKIGVYLRAGFYRFSLSECHPNAVISFAVLLSQTDTEICSGVYIGPQCNIGKCRIEQDTLLGSAVHIMSGKQQHSFDDLNTPIREQGGKFEKVNIGQNCWIGNGALIMANIGDNCIVAAGSVVINDVESGSIVAGNPAKIIKKRS